MVLNGYTVLSLFLSLLRLLLGVAVLIVVVRTRSAHKKAIDSNANDMEYVESRMHLLSYITVVLAGLNLLSWPVLYLTLQSHVHEWPSIMCIYGVTQIGKNTIGVSRFLPLMLSIEQWLKPIVVIAGGASVILYAINRRTTDGAIVPQFLLCLLLAGSASVVDSVVESGWLAIPKNELNIAGGCCTTTLNTVEQGAKFTPQIRLGPNGQSSLARVCVVANLLLIGALFHSLWSEPRRKNKLRSGRLLIGSLICFPVSLLYLVEYAAPTILGLPFHHCAYDLLTVAPESLIAVVLYAAAVCFCTWSFVTDRFASCEQTVSIRPEFVRRLLFYSLFCYTGSTIVMTLEILLA